MKYKSARHDNSKSPRRKSSRRKVSKSSKRRKSKSPESRSSKRRHREKSINKHHLDSSRKKRLDNRKHHGHTSKYRDSSPKKIKEKQLKSERKSQSEIEEDAPSVKVESRELVVMSDSNDASILKKQRRSRWSTNEYDKCVIPGMPTTLPANLRSDDAEVYVIQLQITDTTNKLQKMNYTSEIEAMSRLPSPDPVYGTDGKRINTKEYRARERLEERKRQLMLKLHSLRPELVPQADKIGGRYEEKIFIPQEDHPEINLIGLIIGPRGLTLKELEKEFGVKIIIRGKGSVHNGKIINSALPGEDDPLHAFVTSFSKENVDRAVYKINSIVNEGIECPEHENDLRKNQMKQLAILNGTYRETDGLNKLKMLSEAQTIVTNTIICSLCGGAGHLPRDCKARYDSSITQVTFTPQNIHLDGEYTSFMTELGPEAKSTVLPAYLGLHSQQQSTQSTVVNSFVRKFVFNS